MVGVDLASFVVDLAQACVEVEICEYLVAFAEDGVEIGSWIEEVFDEDLAIFSVVVELAGG